MRNFFLVSVIISATATAPAFYLNAQVTSAVKTKLFSISTGEKPVYSECQLFMSSAGNSVSLVTNDTNEKYYFYENGKKRGPFEDFKEIEKEYSRWKGWLIPGIDTMNSSDARKERLKRLRSDEGQVRYLSMFMLLMKRRLQQFAVIEKNEEIRLLAAAYNYGFLADLETLKSVSRERFFYTGIIPPETKYNYSDIAAEFSLKYCGM